MGRLSEVSRVAHIVDVLDAPEDSERLAGEFILGTQGCYDRWKTMGGCRRAPGHSWKERVLIRLTRRDLSRLAPQRVAWAVRPATVLVRHGKKCNSLPHWPAPILCTSSYVSPGTVSGKG